MGYYTDWKVRIIPESEEERAIKNLNRISGYHFDSNGYLGEAKWYESEDSLAKLTMAIPDIIVIVDADGEESGDIYRLYAWNGKVEYVKPVMTYQEPDWMEEANDVVEKAILRRIREEEEKEKELLKKLVDKHGLPEDKE